MQGKKKYIALILFLFLGLMVFTFANPAETEEKEDNKANTGEVVKEDGEKKTTTKNNGNLDNDQNVVTFNTVNTRRNAQNALTENNVVVVTNQTEDDSYAKALEMVKKAEESLVKADYSNAQSLVNNLTDGKDKDVLQERLDEVLNCINVSELVTNLEKMVKEAASLTDMNDARDYRTDKEISEKVNALAASSAKDELISKLNELSKVLDDKTLPTITGINDVDITNKVVSILVEDDNDVTIILNGKEVTASDIEKIEEEGSYTLEVTDAAFNTTAISFVIDKTLPTASLSMRTTKPTNKNLIVTLKASEAIETPKGWSKVSDTVFTKKYTRNTTENVEIIDKAGNVSTIKVEINNIDMVVPTATITFSNNNGNAMTNQDVIVTLVSSEPIETPKDWNKIDDVTFTKIYSKNAKDSVVIIDKAGNSAELKYEVKRIDKVAPNGTFTFSNDNGNAMTNKDVIVTLTTNESILTPEGWTRVRDKVYTKVYSENAKNEKVVITDKAGNSAELKYEVKRIDKVAPNGTFTFSNDNGNAMTNKDVTVTLTTNESILTPEGWTKVQDKVYTKVYSKNTKDSVVITDKAGNTVTLAYEVKGIDKEAPNGTITLSNNGATTNKDVTVTLITDEAVVTPKGWTKVSDVKYTKVYADNAQNEMVTITDMVGNSTTLTYEVKGINKVTYVNSVDDLKTAISNAKAGDEVVISKTIDVNDNILIDKAIHLKGENGSKVNVIGNVGIKLTASGTTIENIVFDNTSNTNINNRNVVSISGAKNVSLKNVSVKGIRNKGIVIENSNVIIDGANVNITYPYGGAAISIDKSTVTILNSYIYGPNHYNRGSIIINSGSSKLIVGQNNTINNGITSDDPSQTDIKFNDGRTWESTGGINSKTWTLK